MKIEKEWVSGFRAVCVSVDPETLDLICVAAADGGSEFRVAQILERPEPDGPLVPVKAAMGHEIVPGTHVWFDMSIIRGEEVLDMSTIQKD